MELEVNDRHPASGGESVMNDMLIQIVLNSSGYIVRNHPGYEPRYMFEHLYVIVNYFAPHGIFHVKTCL